LEQESQPVRPEISLPMIGRIHTPFTEASGTPIQSVYAEGVKGKVVVEAAFASALTDIEGFERVWLIYWMDRAAAYKPLVVPYRDTQARGLFATRSPCRPIPIGISVVRLAKRDGCTLHVVDVDILDNTPLLDIKPYVPEFDAHPSSKAGWFHSSAVDRRVADRRFHHEPG
jgi:tRNA-Thr(GGU) m(6)t(6)A37 methyltransferase TsaA